MPDANLLDPAASAVLAEYHGFGRRSGSTGPGEPMYAVGPETGTFLNILAGSFQAPSILEIGTSFGYSTLWLAAAARRTGGRVVTLELYPHKSDFARRMIEKAGLADVVDFRVGDAVNALDEVNDGVDLVLLDLWKDLYVTCLQMVLPKLAQGAVIVADNMIVPGGADVRRYRHTVAQVDRLSSILLPIGSGLEISRLEDHR